MSYFQRRAVFSWTFFWLCALPPAWTPADAETDEPADAAAAEPTDNPYLARPDLSAEQLRAFIERMQESPASLRERPGFADALLDAAERILAADPTSELREFAVLTQLDALHQQADVGGSEEADRRLAELATAHQDDDSDAGRRARIIVLEHRVLASDDREAEELPALLDEVRTALADQPLDARYLRLASATVRVINRLPSDEAAAEAYKQFGELFAASEYDELRRYGKKIAKGTKPPSLVGKPLEIAGTTMDGAKFDITEYRGRVVLVDFWATWCPPCRAQLPEMKTLYEQYHSKGFEVVGISVDDDLAALAQVVGDEEIPWVNLVGQQDGNEMKHPLAEKYNIRAIPATFLIDREGKVIAEQIHGNALAKQLEKLLGDSATHPN